MLELDAPKDDGFGHFVGPTDLFSTPVLQQSAQTVGTFAFLTLQPTSFNNSQSLFNTPNQPTPQPQAVSKQSILELYNNPMTQMPLAPSVSLIFLHRQC